MSSPRTRREVLINGRRVRISDLLDAGLLTDGQELFFEQRLGMTPHRSTVVSPGRLRLPDGREFATPSAAASAASGLGTVPGWEAWRVGRNGPTLHELRRQLLAMVAAETATSDAESRDPADSAAARDRLARLEAAREKAKSGEPEALTVRQLLGWWGFEDRDREVIRQIDADLANHGLTTVPDFRAVSLDRTVRLVTPPEPAEQSQPGSPISDDSGSLQADLTEESDAEIGLTLGNLLSGEDTLVSIPPTASLQEAITIMRLNDFSQLAVLPNPYTLHGAVSWKSIAQAQHADPRATLRDTIVPAQVFDYDVRLLRVLDTIRREGFIFVRDFDRKITGIITAADVVDKYDETATPFLLIGEVDQELRRLIQGTFDADTVREACDAAGQTFRSFETMTMGNYQAVLDNPKCWAQLGWPVDRKIFISRLDHLRRVRNGVMHFNPDPVKPADVDKLRLFLDLIRTFNK
ncbi:CBS domain-containing protein [Micromonospora sp. HM5-17]|jgi:CBS domain-containing protein|uniref:restriction system modified-DNA reader domain-containing protein n=1 Tax=Micromonospora sp. HM5-17 TaxID=2487710 RepID=UPI00131551E7|nr:CBS domain-containing protein [Micromonospora sp. HM5-17]